jgi:hypothetical protein
MHVSNSKSLLETVPIRALDRTPLRPIWEIDKKSRPRGLSRCEPVGELIVTAPSMMADRAPAPG